MQKSVLHQVLCALCSLTQRDHFLAVLGIEDLTHSIVNGGQTAEDALKAGNDGDGVIAGKIAQSQQYKQHGEAAKDHLGGPVVLQCANEHEGGEDAPQQQVVAHSDLAGRLDALKRVDPDENQRPPEQTVSGKCGAAKGVALAQLPDTGNDLSQTAQSDAHSNNGDGQGEKTCVVQVQQNCGHTEAQQTKGAGVGDFCFQISRHEKSSIFFSL